MANKDGNKMANKDGNKNKGKDKFITKERTADYFKKLKQEEKTKNIGMKKYKEEHIK